MTTTPPESPHVSPVPQNVQMQLPTWLPLIVALVSGGGAGYLGSDLAQDQEPAVLAGRVEDLRDDIASLKSQINALSQQVSNGAVDRWRRSDHEAWEQRELRPMLQTLERRIDRLEQH